MLVSPLMGPILGGVFGAIIKNQELWQLGFKNELIGLVTCLIVGFVFGFIPASVSTHGANWGSMDSWPTDEMKSRGLLRSLWVGVLVAIPSGAGVALSILGGNAGSLVGVAISASLLPPVVDAGMLWAFALVSTISHPELDYDGANFTDAASNGNASLSDSVTRHNYIRVPPNCLPLKDNTYQFVYSCSMQNEAVILGMVSLLLTGLNILCIVVMAMIVLKIKEVAPHIALSEATEAFWKKDLKVIRTYYATMKGGKQSADLLANYAREKAKDSKYEEEVSKAGGLQRSFSTPTGGYAAKFAMQNDDCEVEYETCPEDSDGKLIIRKFAKHENQPGTTTPEASTQPQTPSYKKEELLFRSANIMVRNRKPRISRQQSSPGYLPAQEFTKEGRFVIHKIKEESDCDLSLSKERPSLDPSPSGTSLTASPSGTSLTASRSGASLTPSPSGASLTRQDAVKNVP